jgi:hypothetical protein
VVAAEAEPSENDRGGPGQLTVKSSPTPMNDIWHVGPGRSHFDIHHRSPVSAALHLEFLRLTQKRNPRL